MRATYIKLTEGFQSKAPHVFLPMPLSANGRVNDDAWVKKTPLRSRADPWKLVFQEKLSQGLSNLTRTQNIPEGYSAITPYFTVANADRLMEFLKEAFDATVIKESRYPDNTVQHARMLIKGSIIMLNEAIRDYPANVSQMHLFVEDCDDTYGLAMKSSASSIMTPNLRPHGDRMAGIKDPCGNIWWIATCNQPAD